MLTAGSTEVIGCTDPAHDRGCPCQVGGDPLPLLADVWCSRCDRTATVAFRLTLGEVRSYCDVHAWALRAPRGRA